MSGLETNIEIEKPREECGVLGIYAPGEPLPELAYLGLQALQHRGQQGAGISVSNGEQTIIYQDLGLVRDVFAKGSQLSGLAIDGILAAGHTRYGTSSTPDHLKRQALQPMAFMSEDSTELPFTLSTNGHIEDLSTIAEEYGVDTAFSSSDSEVTRNIIAAAFSKLGNFEAALLETLPKLKGAYSSVFTTNDTLFAVRDPQGFRPLHLGKLGDNGWVVASEIAALDIIDAEPIREVEPGELVRIDQDGLNSVRFAEGRPALCSFEFVYFSRPDNEMYGEVVTEFRERIGRILASKNQVDADLVMGVPESGKAAAKGYSMESNIPDLDRLIKNNYVDRSFILPTQNERQRAVRNKLNPVKRLIKGMRLVVIDDSIVRGTTSRELVRMLREAGASEVHFRVASPPYRWPCFMGMDTGRAEELWARGKTIEEMREDLDVDSLDFVTDEEMQTAAGNAAGKICTACTTGLYPIEISPRK